MIFNRKPNIQLKTPEQLEIMARAGRVVAETLSLIEETTSIGTTLREIDALAREELKKHGATSSFLGYHGYPAVVCTSVNQQVVHGIPSDYALQSGDILSVDFGAIVDGWHGDSALTLLLGEVSEEAKALSRVTNRAMWAGINASVAGNTLGDVGHAIQSVIEADNRWGLIEDYSGHGIGTEMHMEPFVPNYGEPGEGMRLDVGMAIAIEPMVTAGTHLTKTLSDNWTVVTIDDSIASHWEHTVAITSDGPKVLTLRQGEVLS
ncbi:MAG: type I methionyl aminopeptidase [Candidatus Nanopelagicales bacterium]